MLTEVLRKYRKYDPATDTFDAERSLREYARVLGVSHPTLVMIFQGKRRPGMTVMRRLIHAFPSAAAEVSAAMLANGNHAPAPQPVAAGGE